MNSVDPDLPRIPGFAVEAVLGSGGMATVYRGRQLALDRAVAIKLLRAYGRDADELRRRFEQEAKLIAALDHPHIVAIYEVTRSEDGDACYVMPYFPHGDLASRPRPMPEAEVKRVLGAVLDALGHAHAAGVVHRDVKPENVLFDARGKPLLADFGVAMQLTRDDRLTAHGRTVGSSLQMSPEQARGEKVDGRSDLYSVGCLAFELIAGYPPFDGDDFLAVALKHQQDPVPRLPQQWAHWQAWIDRALAKAPEQRFVDAAEMAAALEAIDAKPAPATPRKLPRAALAVAVSVVLALLLAFAGFAWLGSAEDELADAEELAAATPASNAEWRAIEQAIEAGRWFGEEDSAAAQLLPQLGLDPPPATALALRETLLVAVDRRLAQADGAELIELGNAWAAFVLASDALAVPVVADSSRRIEQRLRPLLERARSQRDRAEIGEFLTLALALPQPSPDFAESANLVAGFPARGEPFRDGDGPELLLIPGGRLAGFARPFAVTRHEITREHYQRFAAATSRRPANCRDNGRTRRWDAPGFEQAADEPVTCVSHADAQAYAAWLSARSGRSYRLPTLAEWNALQAAARSGSCANLRGDNAACGDRYPHTAPVGRFASIEGMPQDLDGNVREWTSSCEFKEIGAVRRAMVNFGRTLQGKERDRSGRVCIGRHVAGSGHRDSQLQRAAIAEEEDHAAPDIGFRLIREIR